MRLCEYGCGNEAKFLMTSGKWCCSSFYTKCPAIKKRNVATNKIKQSGKNNAFYGKTHTEETKKKLRESHLGKSHHKESWKKELKIRMQGEGNPFFRKSHSEFARKKIGEAQRHTLSKLRKKYPFFSKIEEMRYNPDKPGKKEIQVHCKNHNCPNSKEQGGWFTPTKIQLYERIRQLEKSYGNGGSYFYCSEECKQNCPLYHFIYSSLEEIKPIGYTQEEYQTFREFVLERDNYKCQYCGKAAEHVHHERPQKLEPFFALDPDLAWSVCKECHFKYGHKDECSTGQLARKICGGA